MAIDKIDGNAGHSSKLEKEQIKKEMKRAMETSCCSTI